MNRHKAALTAETLKHELRKDARYKSPDERDVEFFVTILPREQIITTIGKQNNSDADTDTDELLAYNQDWFALLRGQSRLVLLPSSTEHVSKILAYCNEKMIPVVTQGGNTNPCGGGVPVYDEVIVNLKLMNEIHAWDQWSGVISCDAGCTLSKLDNFLKIEGHVVPVDIAARDQIQIGGAVSANAAGLRFIRFGSLHGNVLGLEVVRSDGTVLNLGSMCRKDNTGYDLKQIFIGGEGTLGIVTKVTFVAPPRRPNIQVALLGLPDWEHVLGAFYFCRNQLSEILSAFEFWDQECVDAVVKYIKSKDPPPLKQSHRFYVMIETAGNRAQHDAKKLEAYLHRLSPDVERLVASSTSRTGPSIESIWAWRGLIPEAMTRPGPYIGYDVSLSIPHLYDLIEEARVWLLDESAGRGLKGWGITDVLGFGHIGDGSVHM